MRIPARVGLLTVLPSAFVFGAGMATATSTPSTTVVAATTTVTAPTTVAAPTAVPTTTPPAASTTTTTLPPVDLLVGVPWIQRAFASPCSDGTVQMIGGSAVDNGALAVVDDVVPLDPIAGLAVAFLSCHGGDGSRIETTALLVKVARNGVVESVAEQSLGGRATITAVQLPTFTVESADGLPQTGSCCAPFVRRRQFTVGLDGFEITDDAQLSAFEQTVQVRPVVGGNGDLVRASVPAAALCYRWNNVYLATQDPGAEPPPVAEPSAELQTIRLALIHVTGQWITPTSQMSREMANVVSAYQESHGLAVDGIVGEQTTNALAADLGCTGGESFNQVMPPRLGPRRFASVSDLLVATQRYATTRTSGNSSFDALLTAAGWDGANSLFLGCYRWEMPLTGMSCSWSGTTPLQLIGLVDDGSAPGIGSFSVLYARSAAAP